MQLTEAVRLINHSVKVAPTVYADLGCGSGLFTKALAQLLVPNSLIYAVDKSNTALNNVSIPSNIQLKKLNVDFINDELPFSNLSGILMANSLHYVRDKNTFLTKAIAALAEDGYFIIVEYENEKSNRWVPFPVTFSALEKLFNELQFYSVQKLQTYPSRYQGNMYSALVKRALEP